MNSLYWTEPNLDIEQAAGTGLSHVRQQPHGIFAAAQRGDLVTIQELVESGDANVNDRDDQNVTPLHWAAINAELETCRYLIEQGAEVDAIGGDLQATPLQWAARNGNLYVVHLLISNNADPTITDSQGYNTLHLVIHSSSVMLLLYLLHQPVNVDSRDLQGHTPLMWAAYQGGVLPVDLLLKCGANLTLKDDMGLTPLHWAVTKGNWIIFRRLVEMGADIHTSDAEGRTPRDVAVQLKSLVAWRRAMEEGGMSEFGFKRTKPFDERKTKIAIFVLPCVFLNTVTPILSFVPWYIGLVPFIIGFFAMHHIVTRVLLNMHSYIRTFAQRPYFAGSIAASIAWVGHGWATTLFRETPEHPFVHLAFALVFDLCAYYFFDAITHDAGTYSRPTIDRELKAIIEDLASEGRLNDKTFCIQCMARKSFRSKHCRICKRCVSRSDHHFPWVWNCVAANDYRQFLLLVTMLAIRTFIFFIV